MKIILRAAMALGLLTVVSSAPTRAQAIPEGATKEMVAKGNEIYHKSGLCFACHGQDGKGMVGPNLADDVWLHSKGTYEDIIKTITVGVAKEQSKSGVPMPAKGGSAISAEDIKAVAAYVYSLGHK